MTEPCDLDRHPRPRADRRQAALARELMESCIARIEAVDPAVNAMVARDFERARAAAGAAEEAVARGEELPALHGLPVGVKDLDEVAGLRTTWGSPIFRDHVPSADHRHGRPREGGRRHRDRQDQHAGMGRRRQYPQCRLRRHRQSVRPAQGRRPAPPAARRWRWPPAWCRCAPAPTPADPCATRPPSAAWSASARRPAWSRARSASPAGTRCSVLGPMARTVADACAAAVGDGQRRRARSAGDHDPRPPAFARRGVLSAGAGRPRGLAGGASPRISASPPPSGRSPRRSPRRCGLFRHVFARADEATPDCADADETFEVLRVAGIPGRPPGAGAHAARRTSGRTCAPTSRKALRYYRPGRGAGAGAADRLLSALAGRSSRTTISSCRRRSPSARGPGRELYPAEIDGKPTRTYFHWLALAYAVTLAGHPAVSLPVGLDQNGMPFGLQIVGPRGGDALVLAVAAALEALLAGDPRTARPLPDLAKLKAARPISEHAQLHRLRLSSPLSRRGSAGSRLNHQAHQGF